MLSFFKSEKKDSQTITQNKKIFSDYNKNINFIKKEFCSEKNKGLIIREIYIPPIKKQATLFFLDGMINDTLITDKVIHPLEEDFIELDEPIEFVKHVVKTKDYKQHDYFDGTITDIVNGFSVLFIEGSDKALSFETIKVENRGVQKTIRETVIKGPQEAFTESIQINRSLIRKRLKSEKLINETLTVGNITKSNIDMIYLDNLANEELVNEVRQRINAIDADSLTDIELLEQAIEDRPYSIIPSILSSERPDRATAFLLEGHIILLMEASSSCIIAPVTFWGMFHSPEDMYQRWIYGNFIRLVRMFAIFFALLTPSLYIAVTQFHPDMMPTDLLLAITATRERVPFPAIVEVLIMEISFELLREGGIRIPSPMGSTIGIVGALILGQAAVEANIISPILVIVIAITGLSSFAIVDNNLAFMIRIGRFFFLFLASILGSLGLAIAFAISISYIVSTKSFGVPFMSPVTPYYKSSGDTEFRRIWTRNWLRPQHVKPKNSIRKNPFKGRSK